MTNKIKQNYLKQRDLAPLTVQLNSMKRVYSTGVTIDICNYR